MTEQPIAIPTADPKSWAASRTIVASLWQALLGVLLIAGAALGWLPEGTAALGAGQIALAATAIAGRVRAEQPIAPVPAVQVAADLVGRLANRIR